MKVIRLNTPAVSSQLNIKELSILPYVSHMMYEDGSKIIQQASPEKPVFRLAKDYEVDNLRFGMNLLTDDNNAGKAEKWMDKVAKKLSLDEVRRLIRMPASFTYLKEKYRSKK